MQDDGGILVFDDGDTIVELDLNNANLIFEVDNADLGTINPNDGLDIILTIGAAVGNTNYMQLNIDSTQDSQDTED